MDGAFLFIRKEAIDVNETTGFTVRLSTNEKEALRSAAQLQGTTMSMLFRMLLNRYLIEVTSEIPSDHLELRERWLFGRNSLS